MYAPRGSSVASPAGRIIRWWALCVATVMAICSSGLMGISVASAAAAPASLGVSATIDIQRAARGLAVSPDGIRLYATIAFNGGGALRVIDTGSNAVLRSIDVGEFPVGVVVSPTGTRVYVANSESGTVSVIDTSSDEVTATIGVGTTPRSLAINAAGTRVYVANIASKSISVIDTATDTVVSTITGFVAISNVAVSPDDTRLYVTNGRYSGGGLHIVDSANGTISDTIGVGSTPAGLAVSPDGARVYVTHQDSDVVTVVNTVTKAVATTIGVGFNPHGVAVSADGTRAYVANADDWNMSVIDTVRDTVIATVATGADDNTVAVSPDGTRIYVGNPSNNSVLVYADLLPSAPTTLVATPGVASASITFTAGSTGANAITKYQVKVGNGSWTDVVGTTSPITVTGLTNYATVNIRLRAVNSAGAGAVSTAVSVWPRLASSALTSVKVEGTSKVRAAFAALTPVGGSVSHYWVYAYAKGTNTIAGSCRSTAAARGCLILGLTAGTEYDVAVRGFFTLTGSPTVLATTDSARQTVRTNS